MKVRFIFTIIKISRITIISKITSVVLISVTGIISTIISVKIFVVFLEQATCIFFQVTHQKYSFFENFHLWDFKDHELSKKKKRMNILKTILKTSSTCSSSFSTSYGFFWGGWRLLPRCRRLLFLSFEKADILRVERRREVAFEKQQFWRSAHLVLPHLNMVYSECIWRNLSRNLTQTILIFKNVGTWR